MQGRYFDENESFQLFDEVNGRVAKAIPSGAWEWTKKNRPDLIESILTAEQGFYKLNEAYAQEVQDAQGDNLHPMRDTCQQAGHCLQLTREMGCQLYPAAPGWCRERIRRVVSADADGP